MLTTIPDVVFFVAPPMAAHDKWDVLVQLAAPLGALIIFFGTTWFTIWQAQKSRAEDRVRDREIATYAREKDREARHLDMKRDVLLDAAPALMEAYIGLVKINDQRFPVSNASGLLAGAVKPMARMQAVASSETLTAAAELMGQLAESMLELVDVRVVGIEGREATQAEQMQAFHEVQKKVLPLYARFLKRARSEVGLDFDEDAFIADATAAADRQYAIGQRILSQFDGG
jgi:hypothetical protein